MVRAEPASLSATPVAERFAAELVPLERMLSLATGATSLSVAICNSPATCQALIDLLVSRTGSKSISVRRDSIDLFFDDLPRLLRPTNPLALLVDGVADDGDFRQWLNRSREKWGEVFAGPVVFWMSSAVAEAMSHGAPDWWAWISHEFDFTAVESGGPVSAFFGETEADEPALWSNRSRLAKRERP